MNLALAATAEQLAVAYLVDGSERFEPDFTIERRSPTTGELLERETHSNASTYASFTLHYTTKGLQFAWSPSSSLAETRMFMTVVGYEPAPLPRSLINGDVTMTSTGELVVERPSLARGSVRVGGRPIARLVGRRVFASDLSVIESDAGSAVVFFGSEFDGQRRRGYQMVIGDGGVGLRLSKKLENWRDIPPMGRLLPIDRSRVLHISGTRGHVAGAVIGCEGSSALDGLTCATPRERTF
ncbi:hypothetical protein PPSIR1_19007 [Plesiocystis pacifica SIR-1]|uniref:Uncharacterized protein n=1 Tax=Plesiocystis pacifica SIR-1 TaxID=391625 RepID=A6GGL8_9BACT|nr:hypothetical protein [Plesiocystis pacifica]EDM74978.1 hypothetical protein PPSIR1_19007 [Plesiocystis pacifica SIR-1]